MIYPDKTVDIGINYYYRLIDSMVDCSFCGKALTELHAYSYVCENCPNGYSLMLSVQFNLNTWKYRLVEKFKYKDICFYNCFMTGAKYLGMGPIDELGNNLIIFDDLVINPLDQALIDKYVLKYPNYCVLL